jgi:hypothetical protein
MRERASVVVRRSVPEHAQVVDESRGHVIDRGDLRALNQIFDPV